MKVLVLVLLLALCACTSQQYAQFNQRINDSVSRTPEPLSPLVAKSETTTNYAGAPALIPPARIPESIQQPTPTPKLQPKQPTAKGMDLVDGAIVCPSMDEANWLFGQINMARHARLSLSPDLRGQSARVNGFDYGGEPRPSDYRCQFVPAGTPMNVKMDMGVIPIVWGTMKDGLPFAGVTIPNMVSH